jgi:cardiolipin synthase
MCAAHAVLAISLLFNVGVVGPGSSLPEVDTERVLAGRADASTVEDVHTLSALWQSWQVKSVSGRAAQIGRWAAIAAVLLLAWIGFLHITRGTAVRHVRGVGADGAPVGVSEPHFPLSIALLTGTPLTAGNRVEIALNGDGTYARLWEDLRSARRSITLQLYYGNLGRVADTLHEILVNRAKAGVRVFVLYDAFGTLEMPRHRVESLRKSGIRVEPFRPLHISALHLAQNRSHARGIVIDGRVGWTGGFGIDDKWLGDGRRNGSWRETNVRFEGPAVRQLQAAFAAAWTEATGVLFTGRATLAEHADGVTAAGLLYATPTLGSTAAERFMAASISGARTSLYITNAYFAPDDNLLELLVAAARRGVEIRVLTAGPRTDVRTVRFAGRAVYERLLTAGVRIYEWQPTTLHAKVFVADSLWSTIGSMNFDNRSLALNDETTLMILDAEIGRQMVAIFEDDLRDAKAITLEQFRQRSWLEQPLELGSRFLIRLL